MPFLKQQRPELTGSNTERDSHSARETISANFPDNFRNYKQIIISPGVKPSLCKVTGLFFLHLTGFQNLPGLEITSDILIL